MKPSSEENNNSEKELAEFKARLQRENVLPKEKDQKQDEYGMYNNQKIK